MIVVLVIVAIVRLRLLNFPLERDEGEYAYAGQLILDGIPPYQLACNMKFPGTYLAYAGIMALFGQTPAGIHFGLLLMTTATALMLYWLGKKILDEITGAVAASCFAILAASPSMLGLSGHATHFAGFFVTAGVCLMWLARQNINWLSTFALGICFGVAVLMKQHAMVLGAWAGIAFATTCLLKKEHSLSKRIGAVVLCAFGMILPFAVCCLILWRTGVFRQFWFWTIDYARQYASVVPVSYAPFFFWHGSRAALLNGFVLLPFAVAGMVLIFREKRLVGSRGWLAGFGMASALSVCPDFYFRKHYFLLMLPAAGLLAGCAISIGENLCRQKDQTEKSWHWPVLVYILALIAMTTMCASIWFVYTPVQVARKIYQADPFPEAGPVATFIRANSTEQSRLAILGSEPELYFLSHRHSATSYIYVYGLMEPQPFAHQMQMEMITQIETNAPGFMVFVEDKMSWFKYPDADETIFHWWDSYQTNYTLVAVADVLSDKDTIYAWGADIVQRYGKVRGSALEVYQRKGKPTLTSTNMKAF